MTSGTPSDEEIDPRLLDLWARVFDMARSGDTKSLAAYLEAGIPVDLTNDRGGTLGDAGRILCRSLLIPLPSSAETVSAGSSAAARVRLLPVG